ncbi:MAG: hypothetical protein Q9209_001025 [Squamulea sp. 1 TL-2023]
MDPYSRSDLVPPAFINAGGLVPSRRPMDDFTNQYQLGHLPGNRGSHTVNPVNDYAYSNTGFSHASHSQATYDYPRAISVNNAYQQQALSRGEYSVRLPSQQYPEYSTPQQSFERGPPQQPSNPTFPQGSFDYVPLQRSSALVSQQSFERDPPQKFSNRAFTQESFDYALLQRSPELVSSQQSSERDPPQKSSNRAFPQESFHHAPLRRASERVPFQKASDRAPLPKTSNHSFPQDSFSYTPLHKSFERASSPETSDLAFLEKTSDAGSLHESSDRTLPQWSSERVSRRVKKKVVELSSSPSVKAESPSPELSNHVFTRLPPTIFTTADKPKQPAVLPRREAAIQRLEDMGFGTDEVDRAMRAALDCPERAIEYLVDPSSLPGPRPLRQSTVNYRQYRS